ncbi:MAG: ribose 5-phosphate isomerase B [Flavobacteriales bacterium]|jgi:ribose 5-phosphate isomerase B
MKTIHIGCDHAGYELKAWLIDRLSEYRIQDHGTYSPERADYPDVAHPLAEAVERDASMGILICGSANGVCMTANKHQGIRAALCWTEEIARLARLHNNANVICLPARFISPELALAMVRAFIETEFEGGRHEDRVNKIACS